jgi:hypothetical protein
MIGLSRYAPYLLRIGLLGNSGGSTDGGARLAQPRPGLRHAGGQRLQSSVLRALHYRLEPQLPQRSLVVASLLLESSRPNPPPTRRCLSLYYNPSLLPSVSALIMSSLMLAVSPS